ncbi:CAHM6 protein, partial [Rhynochetos jubatus]|nr:CAHM6 protein [Rhynochetos jubatus]
MDKIKEALDFCFHHQTVLGYSLISLLTAASEHIFSTVLFKCPCNSENMLYGSIFLIVPAFILFLFGCMVNTRAQRLLTGICPSEKGCSCIPWRSFTHCCRMLLPVAAKASVAPLTWIAVALLRASFYVCAASGNSLLKNLVCKDKGQECHSLMAKIPCNEKLSEAMLSEFLSLQAQSQLLGWLLIAGTMTVALIATCVSRCYSPVSYLQLKFRKTYLKKEQELFETEAEEHATKLAEININYFFKDTDPPPFPTPSNEDWQKISLLYTFDSQEQFYSMIHKYVNTNRGNNARFGEGDHNPSALGSVDETWASESGF